MTKTASAISCSRCNNPATVLFDGVCASCWGLAEVEQLCAQVARLEAANERLAAALRRLMAGFSHGGESVECTCDACEQARAALSDQGEGWPEVREQAVKEIGLADAEIENHFNHRHGPNQLQAAQRHLRAAQARLGGT